jgi:hypothetical protein
MEKRKLHTNKMATCIVQSLRYLLDCLLGNHLTLDEIDTNKNIICYLITEQAKGIVTAR